MIHFEYSWDSPLNGYRHPKPVLCRHVSVAWKGADTPIELEGVQWSFDVARNHCPPEFCHIGEWSESDAGRAQFLLQIPWTPGLIQAIENERNGGSMVNFQMRFDARYRYAPVHDRPGVEGFPREPVLFAGPLRRAGGREITMQVARDDWLKVLDQIGWGRFDVFELDLESVDGPVRLAEGREYLARAVRSLRDGDWEAACSKCRKALAAVAAADEELGDTEEQEGKLLSRLVSELLGSEDPPHRRDAFDHSLKAVSELRHLGSHYRRAGQPQRHDAEFAVTMTMSLFRFIAAELRRK